MFAGRYLWWMLIAIAVFLFFTMCFDYVTWLSVVISGCTRVAGSCGPLILTMSGSMKPSGVYLAGGIILVVTFARIHYIGLNWLWALVAAVWFVASAPFPLLLASGWTGQLKPQAVLEALPVSFLFLVTFCIYICSAFEESGTKPFGVWRPVRLAAHLSAIYCALLALAETSAFATIPGRMLGEPGLTAVVAGLQPGLQDILTLGSNDRMLALIALGIFVGCMAFSILQEHRDALHARFVQPIMLRGSRH